MHVLCKWINFEWLIEALENHDFLEFFLIWVCIMGSFLSNASRVDPKSRLYKSLFLIHFHRYYFTSISFSVWIWFWLKKEKKKTYIPLGTPIWISLSLNGYIFHPTTFSANFSIGAIQNIFFKHEFLKTLKRFNIQQRYTNTFTLKMTLTKFKLKWKKTNFRNQMDDEILSTLHASLRLINARMNVHVHPKEFSEIIQKQFAEISQSNQMNMSENVHET